MSATQETRVTKRRIFYGWWLLAAGTLALAMQGGVFTYGFAAFFVPLAAELSTSRGALSVAFSFTRLESALLGPIGGYLIDRLGPRTMMFIGYSCFGLGFIFFSRVSSLPAFYLVFALLAVGASWSGFLPVVTAVTNWFARRRGVATGIVSAGVNVGGVLVALVAVAISTFGWRETAIAMGVLVWLLGFPIASVMRHRPQPYGYRPDGDPPIATETPLSGENTRQEQEEEFNFTPMQAMKTQAFWLIAASHSFSLLIVSAVTIHEIPVLVDAGLSYETAASILAAMTGIAIVGRVSGGFLGDKFGMKPTLLACFVMMSIGLVVLSLARTVPQAMVFAVLYGLGYGARAPLLIALRGDYFGPRQFATIMGFSQPIMMIGTFAGPVAAGFAYDAQGNYRMAFTVIALLNMIGALLVFFIKKPSLPQPSQAVEATEQ